MYALPVWMPVPISGECSAAMPGMADMVNGKKAVIRFRLFSPKKRYCGGTAGLRAETDHPRQQAVQIYRFT